MRVPIFYILFAAGIVADSLQLDSRQEANIIIDPATHPLDALAKLQKYAYERLVQSGGDTKRALKGCSLTTTTVRKDWYLDQQEESNHNC